MRIYRSARPRSIFRGLDHRARVRGHRGRENVPVADRRCDWPGHLPAASSATGSSGWPAGCSPAGWGRATSSASWRPTTRTGPSPSTASPGPARTVTTLNPSYTAEEVNYQLSRLRRRASRHRPGPACDGTGSGAAGTAVPRNRGTASAEGVPTLDCADGRSPSGAQAAGRLGRWRGGDALFVGHDRAAQGRDADPIGTWR